MKKIILPALFLGAIALGSTSCKKDYACECSFTGGSYTYTMTETKKAAAYATCEGKGVGPITIDGVAVPADNSTTCTIK